MCKYAKEYIKKRYRVFEVFKTLLEYAILTSISNFRLAPQAILANVFILMKSRVVMPHVTKFATAIMLLTLAYCKLPDSKLSHCSTTASIFYAADDMEY